MRKPRAIACLRDRHLLMIASAIAFAVVGTIVFANKLSSRHLTGAMCSACAAMTNEADRQACMPGCTPDPMPSGGGGGTCDTQPNWPDCASFSCSSGNWTCTQMRQSSGSMSSMPSGGMMNGGVTKESCLAGCNTMMNTTQAQKDMCISGCNSMGTGGGSTWSSGGTSGGTSGTTYSAPAGTWIDPNVGKTPKQMCMDGAGSNQAMMKICDCMEPKSGSCVAASSISASGGYDQWNMGGMSKESCLAGCGNMTNASQSQKDMCVSGCNSMGSGGGMYGAAGLQGNQGCVDGCKNMTDASCATATGDSLLWCNAKKNNTCQQECDKRMGGGQGNGGGMSKESCLAGCGNMTNASQSQKDMCVSGCNSMGSGGQPGSGGMKMACKYPDGKTLWCSSPHVNCSESQTGGPILSDREVGSHGSTASCDSGSTGGGGGGDTDPGMRESEMCCPTCSDPTGKSCPLSSCHRVPIGRCQYERSGGGGQGGKYICQTQVQCWNAGNGQMACPSAMPPREYDSPQPGMNCWPSGSGGGGGVQWNDLSATKTNLLSPLQNYKRQANDDMPRRAKENGVEIAADMDNFLHGIDQAMQCINTASTIDMLNSCPQIGSIDKMSQSIWNKIQSGGMNRQFAELESQLQQMEQVIAQLGGQGNDVSDLKNFYQIIRASIDAAKTMTPDQLQPAMQNIYDMQSKFWQSAESFRNSQNGKTGNGGYGYADQCEMIRKKMGYVGDDKAAMSLLQDMYGKCIKQAQGAVTGKGFDERQFTQIQDQFDAYGQQVYAQKACDMADGALKDAGSGIQDAPSFITKVKNTTAQQKLQALLTKAKDLLNRAYGFRQKNKCDDALNAMQDMENIGAEADRIMQAAGIRNIESTMGVNYDQQYSDVSQRIAKDSGTDMQQLKKQLAQEGFGGAELAILDSMDPKLAARLFEKSAGSQGSDLVKAAANGNVSPVKLEAIIEQNAELLQKIADLELENTNLKTGIRGVVDQIRNNTFNPKIAPKIAALLDVASSLPEKEFKAKYAQYVQESNDENYKTGIDPFKDVHTFDKEQQWFVAAVKAGTDSGLFKGKRAGEFAPNDPAILADVSLIFARAQSVDQSGDSPESAFAKKAPGYAQEGLAGLEQLGVDFATVLPKSAPTDTATRLQVARLIAAVYGDSLSATDQSSVSSCTDLGKLSTDDQNIIALVATNGIMTCVDGKFDPQGTFNRAQFAAVMQRLSGAGAAAQDNATTATPVKADARKEENATHSAATEESSSSTAPEPVFHADAIHEQELQIIQALVSQYQSQNNKLSVDRTASLNVSLISDLAKSLDAVESDGFARLRKENYPETYIEKFTKDIRTQLPTAQFTKLVEILDGMGQPMQP